MQLLKQHQAEIRELEQRLDSERSRQLIGLRDKLASRKDRKFKEHKRQQEIELQKELLQQKKDLEEVRTKQVKSYVGVHAMHGTMEIEIAWKPFV